METREILLANTRDQKRYRIMSSATTLGELKDQIMRNEGISIYDQPNHSWLENREPINLGGLSFTEGVSNTQLIDNNSQLPMAVNFRGTVTNNLVILMTNTMKNIDNGVSRKELYAEIKARKLEDKVKERYGRNYTQVSSAELEDFINTNKCENTPKKAENTKECKCCTTPEATHPAIVEWVYTGIKALVTEHSLDLSDLEVIMSLIEELKARTAEAKITFNELVESEEIQNLINKAL